MAVTKKAQRVLLQGQTKQFVFPHVEACAEWLGITSSQMYKYIRTGYAIHMDGEKFYADYLYDGHDGFYN